MAFIYNGMPNTERMALTALHYRIQLEQAKLKEGQMMPTPESLLTEILNETKLSDKSAVDPKVVLKAFYRR